MGRCKNCDSGNLIINDDTATYVCKDCGYIGSLKEWINKFFRRRGAWK